MLSLFIMLFIAVGIAAGIGFAIVTLINSAQTSLSIQHNQVRLQNISASIRAGLAVDAGRVLLPVRSDFSARLPDAAPFSTTSTGGEIVYCPAFLDMSAPNQTLTNPAPTGDETYPIGTLELGEKTYVFSGRPGGMSSETVARLDEMGVIAYLVAPQPNHHAPLRCGDVTLADDNYTLLVDGGTVVPIYTVTTDASGSMFVLSADGSKPSGYNGNDRIVKTLGDVAEFIDKYRLSDVTIRLPSSMTVSLADFRDFTARGYARTLRLESMASGTTLTIDASGETVASDNAFIDIPGDLLLKNVSLVGTGASGGAFDVAFRAMPSADVMVDGGRVGGLRTTGGRAMLAGDAQVAPQHGDETTINPVLAEGGEITVRSSADPAVNAPLAISVFYADGGTINLGLGTDISTGLNSWVNRSVNRGKVVVAGSSTTPTVDVNRGSGYVAEELEGKQTVSQTCAAGATTCEVSCPVGKKVVKAGCSTTSGTALTSFGAVDDDTYACEFADLPVPVTPKVTIECDFR